MPVKVNAWVDAGVAELVEALNGHGDLLTVDSCQGGTGRPAYVLFTSVGDLDALVADLQDAFNHLLADAVSLRIERFGGTDEALGVLELAPQAVPAAAAALRAWPAQVSAVCAAAVSSP